MTRDETSTSVQTHLTILQGVIERLASNSKSLKAWCITIVAAILVVVADKNKPDYVLIALIPTVMFCVLDMYYLALEKGFRKAYEGFVCKLHGGTLTINDMYVVKPIGKNVVVMDWCVPIAFHLAFLCLNRRYGRTCLESNGLNELCV